MTPGAPPFINSPDMQQGPPPFFFDDVEIRSFYLAADSRKLAAWCDQFLNVSDRFRFRPLLPLVVLGINAYPRMRTLDPEFADLGYTCQNEYYLMFPVLVLERIMGVWLPVSMSWAYPYIGVDNASSAFTGQEVLGFRKMLGAISFDTDARGRFRSQVTMPGFTALGRGEKQTMLPVLSVRTGPPISADDAPDGNAGTTPHASHWGPLRLPHIESQIEAAAIHLLEMLDPGLFTVVNLKQFRDGSRPDRAIYQSLVRCAFRQSNTGPMTVYDGAAIRILDNATIAAAANLGIGARPVPLAVTGFRTDMWFGDVETMWQAR